MRLVAMLSIHDEDPRLLLRCIASLPQDVTDLIVCPGPYGLFPGASSASAGPTLAEVLATHDACQAAGIVWHGMPGRVYQGNEIEKRQAMMEFAFEMTGPDDWLLVVDADYVFASKLFDLAQTLENSNAYVAATRFVEHFDSSGNPIQVPFKHTIRPLLRAVRGLRMGDNHYTYVFPTGKSPILGTKPATVPELDLHDVMVVEHRRHERPMDRIMKQNSYYEQREMKGIER